MCFHDPYITSGEKRGTGGDQKKKKEREKGKEGRDGWMES